MSNINPYISVIVPTTRIGGLDVLFSGLENLIFKDFELILVDNLYDYRKDIVIEKMKQYSFKIKHIPPLNSTFTATNYCRDMNTGIINSDGNIVLCICDYAWLHPSCLQIHHDFHKNETNNSALICSYNLCKLPK